MERGHHHHHHNIHMSGVGVEVGRGGGGSGSGGGGDRLPQWSVEETRELLMGRAELDPNFMETKRNKVLWEKISYKMREKGYNRSSDQCKSKWKNLVTRYKGCETIEDESMRQQFPYYNELQTIFVARMQRIQWNIEAEGGGNGSKKKAAVAHLSSDDEDKNEDSEEEIRGSIKKKRKIRSGSNVNTLREILEEYMKKQVEMEVQWMKAYEAREEERRVKEMEWRQRMETLENERIVMENRWREREEERRVREEVRAGRRDALITALLNKLRREDHH